ARQDKKDFSLPDDKSARGSTARLASGASDGIATRHQLHTSVLEGTKLIPAMIAALSNLVGANDDRARAALYRTFLSLTHLAVPVAAPLVNALRAQHPFSAEQLRPHVRWLVRIAAHREPLKFGISLLDFAGTEEDLDDLKVLARHDEFTLFAATAA